MDVQLSGCGEAGTPAVRVDLLPFTIKKNGPFDAVRWDESVKSPQANFAGDEGH
eukprot:SAG22_NODE_21973_length_252_cov_1.013072_1_plen_53_part_01